LILQPRCRSEKGLKDSEKNINRKSDELVSKRHDTSERGPEQTLGHIMWPVTHLTHQWTDPWPTRPTTHDLWVMIIAHLLH